MQKAIGTLSYLKGTFADGRVVYWHKTKEYVDKAKNATFYKSPKLAEKAKKNWEEWWNTAKSLTENHMDKLEEAKSSQAAYIRALQSCREDIRNRRKTILKIQNKINELEGK